MRFLSVLMSCALVAAMLAACPAGIGAEADKETQGWSGSVGAGPAVFPKYVGGMTLHLVPIPIISANYNETFYVELFRAGVVLIGSTEKKMGLSFAAEPRWGFRAKDGKRLAGMEARRTSLEGGPAFDWDAGVADVNVSYFVDLTNGTRGRSLQASVAHDIIEGRPFTLTAKLGLDRVDAALRDYYFGVRVSEATPVRPAYRAAGGTDLLYGVHGSYAWDRHHSIVFGFYATRLSDSAVRSPIVERRNALAAWLGYAWRL